MAKRRRALSDSGFLLCPSCKEDVFIGDFYTQQVLAGAHIDDIWFEQDGRYYGRPHSYCRKCAAARARGKTYYTEYLIKLEVRRKEERAAADRAQEKAYQILQQMLDEDRAPKQLPLFDD